MGARIPGGGEAVTAPVCLAVATAPGTRENLAAGSFGDERDDEARRSCLREKEEKGGRRAEAGVGAPIPLRIDIRPVSIASLPLPRQRIDMALSGAKGLVFHARVLRSSNVDRLVGPRGRGAWGLGNGLTGASRWGEDGRRRLGAPLEVGTSWRTVWVR